MLDMASSSSYSLFRDARRCLDQRFPGKWIDRAALISSLALRTRIHSIVIYSGI